MDSNFDGFIDEKEFRVCVGIDKKGDALDESRIYQDPEKVSVSERVKSRQSMANTFLGL